MGRREKKAAVRNLLRVNGPRVTFLQETKLPCIEDKLVRYLCGHNQDYGLMFSPSEGSSSGLVTFWDQKFFDMESSFVHRSYIILQGFLLPMKTKCALVNIYAPNDHGERLIVFNDLSVKLSQLNILVLIGGDFNIVLNSDEKIGGPTNKSAMFAFSAFINSLNLVDPLFKWPNSIQSILPKSISDHNPISICCYDFNWGPKPFKWFDHWADEKDVVSIIDNSCKVSTGKGIATTLRSCKEAAKKWFHSTKERDSDSLLFLERKCHDLEDEIQKGGVIQEKSVELNKLRAKLWARLRTEEHELIQKSRVKWFQVGDRNSKYFHLIASSRRRANLISSLPLAIRFLKALKILKANLRSISRGFIISTKPSL
ncbi:hypothetical protein V6N13_114636 [Hibiscus sabdariffa]